MFLALILILILKRRGDRWGVECGVCRSGRFVCGDGNGDREEMDTVKRINTLIVYAFFSSHNKKTHKIHLNARIYHMTF